MKTWSSRSKIACLVWGLGALYSGCINCSERVEETTGWIEVDADEECPAPSKTLGLSFSGDDLLSVDGSGNKQVLSPASQKCCYDGDFTYDGSSVSTLCTHVENADVPDIGDVKLCPNVTSQNIGDYYWYIDNTIVGNRDVTGASISAPRLESAYPRTWQCVYPVTVRRTSDVCG